MKLKSADIFRKPQSKGRPCSHQTVDTREVRIIII
jgi:hypothetical protein